MSTTLSVIIVSYNTRELTLRCLADLYADLGELPAEVFVVDNGSADDSVAAVRAGFPAVDVIDVGRNAGFGAANNLAIARARGEFILLLNTDAFARPGTTKALVDYIRSHPRAAAVGPRLLNADGSLQRSCYKFPSPGRAFCENTLLTAAFPNHRLLGDYRRWEHNSEREVEFVIGACMLLRRVAVEQVGAFDEQFFMYSEETDLCRRFWDAGWTVNFTPTTEVVHLNGGSGKRQAVQVFNEFNRSAERYIGKHHGAVGLLGYRASVVLGSVVRMSLWSVVYAVVKRRREAAGRRVALWARILVWTVGVRGPGLARPSAAGR